MSDRLVAWVRRGRWGPLPFAAGPADLAGLRHEPGAVRTTAAVGGWVVWAAVLVATLVPAPLSLTVLRCAAPAALAAAIAAAVTGNPSNVATALAAAWSAVVTIAVFLPATAVLFVNGPAYPNERRFPIAPPGPLLVGPDRRAVPAPAPRSAATRPHRAAVRLARRPAGGRRVDARRRAVAPRRSA